MALGDDEEFASRSLASLRTKLLDLSGRNRLLNFSHREPSNTMVRLVDEIPEFVFRDLLNDRTYQLRALPGPQDGQSEWTTAEIATYHRIDPSYDLPTSNVEPIDDKHTDDQLQTLLSEERLGRCLEGIRGTASQYVQELGVHTLHACFGFVRWYESDGSDKAYDAPLVLLPVTLERKLSRGEYVYTVRATGDDPESNRTLRHRWRRDFGLELPQLEPGDDIGDYLNEVHEMVSTKRRWMIRRWLTIAIVRFERVVMFQDLSEDSWNESGPTDHVVLKQLLVGSDAEHTEQYGDVPDLEQPYFMEKLPHLVLDADASQTAAIMDALGGRSLVIQGPPGTGKSQTIANLIAAAMAQNKTVLFVAQKAAAVNVVHDRLVHAGLGEFILSLHSTAASKSVVHTSIAERLALRPEHSNHQLLEERIRELRQQQTQLNEYSRSLNTPVGSLGKTLHELLWSYDSVRGHMASVGPATAGLRLANVASITQSDLRTRVARLRTLETAYLAVRGGDGRGKGPWSFVVDANAAGRSGATRDAIVAATRSWAESLRDLSGLLQALELDCAIITPTAAEILAGGLESVPQLPGDIALLLARIRDDNDAHVLARFVGRGESILATRDSLAGVCANPARIVAAESILHASVQIIDAAGHAGTPIWEVGEFCRTEKHCAQRLAEATTTFRQVCDALGWRGVDARACLRALVTLLEVLSATSRDILVARTSFAVAEKPPGFFEAIVPLANELKATALAYDGQYRNWRSLDPLELRVHARVLASAGWLERWLGSRYEAAVRFFTELTGALAPRLEMARQLEQLAFDLERYRAFTSHPNIQWLSSMGVEWTTADLALLQRVDAWATAVRAHIGGLSRWVEKQRAVIFEGSLAVLDGVVAELRRDGVVEILEFWRDHWASDPGNDEPDAAARAHLANAERLEETLARITGLGISSSVSANDIKQIAAQIAVLRRLEDEQRSDHAAREILNGMFERAATDPTHARAAMKAHEDLARLGLPEVLRRRVTTVRTIGARDELRKLGSRIRELCERERRARVHACALGVTSSESSALVDQESIQASLVRLDAALSAPDGLAAWLAYCAADNEVRADPETAAVLQASVDDGAEPIGLGSYLECLVLRNLIDAAAEANPMVQSIEWSGDRLSETRRRFADLDREVLRLERLSLRERLASMTMPRGLGRGPKSEWTEGALLWNEAQKQRRHVAIRTLVRRAGRALVAIKPCFMMSPLSVAQFLPPHSVEFDLLIIDEASQMRPEDACGAILRARQIVVVGDNKQLPPSTFFGTGREDDDDNDDDPRMESILDWASSTFTPLRDLRWHYRSRHESLIAFSNVKFYNERLALFPSPEPPSSELGVRFRYVDGIYKSSVNRAEAEVVIDEALRQMDVCPDKSMGIVAMNTQQADVIRELLDDAIRKRGQDTYRERWSDGLAPFFVRSLESVQGDERDTILVSMTYGPETSGGKVMQRFGPINGRYGHRRLNVLFTRARERLIVVSSLRSTDILVDPSKSEGVIALRDYLEYAASSGLAITRRDRSTGESESPFETSVADFLRQAGLDVAHQIGVRGFSIDLAIRDRQTGGFLCGIECDGATYHSAKSARDRDRLRQEILEAMGWRIVRVWSTDWFRDRANAQRSLLARIERISSSQSATTH